MTEILLSQLNYHPGQQKVIDEQARFNCVCCGRRWGKSILGIDLLTDIALEGLPTAWFSPTYKMLEEVWRDALIALKPVILKVNVQVKRIELITGGILDFWSLENADAARGRKYARVVVDEAAMVATLQQDWQEAIRPTLTDYEGSAWFFSTPKGMTFFRVIWNLGQDPLRTEWASWQMPTVTNPYINPAEIESARLELPERAFEQEYLALFLEDAGGVFRGVRKIATGKILQPYPSRFGAGIDWGKSNDFTFISVFDQANGKMVDFDRFNKIDWFFQRERLKTMFAKWKPFVGMAERNSIGDPNIEALQREGLPIVGFDTTATSKPPLIESWGLAIERGQTELINDPVIVAEHEAYERTVSTVTGRSRYGAPEGMHDDSVIGAALGWHAITQGKVFRAVVGGQRPVVQSYNPR
ncbi:MAG: hypothetical protein H0X33_13105 [Taibaiella sp.]|nr:hypothetical protein [Taibaiella sp.]